MSFIEKLTRTTSLWLSCFCCIGELH